MTQPDHIGEWREDDLIAALIQPIADDLRDDTAQLSVPANHDLIVTSDALLEDVHFLRSSSPTDVGYKAVAVNVSDLAASGARPRWLSLSLGLPANLSTAWLRAFLTGFAAAMRVSGCSLIGGDTTRARRDIACSVTAMGLVPHGGAVGRHGGQAGDWIAVTGHLGDAALGLDFVLEQRQTEDAELASQLVQRHFRPPFRGNFASALAEARLLHAMMDLSDGLVTDLPRLCKASQVGARIHLDRIPRSALAQRAQVSPEAAACGGEDYELLLCGLPEHWPAVHQLAIQCQVPLQQIGNLTADNAVNYWRDDALVSLGGKAWRHFR